MSPTQKRPSTNCASAKSAAGSLSFASPVATVVTNGSEHRNEIVNDKFTALFGYSQEDVPGVAEWWPLAYPDEAYREKIRTEWEARVAEAVRKRSEITPLEAWVRCKDGSFRYIEFHFASLGETNLAGFVDITDRKLAQDELAKIGVRLIAAQEAESARIARELHDDFQSASDASGHRPLAAFEEPARGRSRDAVQTSRTVQKKPGNSYRYARTLTSAPFQQA